MGARGPILVSSVDHIEFQILNLQHNFIALWSLKDPIDFVSFGGWVSQSLLNLSSSITHHEIVLEVQNLEVYFISM